MNKYEWVLEYYWYGCISGKEEGDDKRCGKFCLDFEIIRSSIIGGSKILKYGTSMGMHKYSGGGYSGGGSYPDGGWYAEFGEPSE